MRRSKTEHEEPSTFAPTLNERSLRLAQARRAKELSESLHGSPCSHVRPRSPSFASPTRIASPRHEPCMHAEEAHCTFAPKVSAGTEGRLNRAGIPASFAERQHFYAQRKAVWTRLLEWVPYCAY